MRRAIALVLLLVLANVNVARAAISCGNETQHRAEPVPVQDHSRHAPASGHEHDASAPEEDGGIPLCCEALATCSMNSEAATERALTAGAEHALLALAAPGDAPLSRTSAPEPPPPRA